MSQGPNRRGPRIRKALLGTQRQKVDNGTAKQYHSGILMPLGTKPKRPRDSHLTVYSLTLIQLQTRPPKDHQHCYRRVTGLQRLLIFAPSPFQSCCCTLDCCFYVIACKVGRLKNSADHIHNLCHIMHAIEHHVKLVRLKKCNNCSRLECWLEGLEG